MREVIAVKEAKEKGYFLRTGWSTNQEMLSNQYYRWCRENKQPFVRITKGREKFAEVELDMLTTDFVHLALIKNRSLPDEYLQEIEALFEKYADLKPTKKDIENHGFSMWSIGDWPACWRIPKDKAEMVALALLDIGQKWAKFYLNQK